MGSDIDHAYANDLIITERFCQWDHHSNEGDGLLAHAEDGTEDSEQQHHKNYYDVADAELSDKRKSLQSAGLGYESCDSGINSLCTVHHPECASDNQNEGNDSCLLAESLKEGREHLPGLRHTAWYKPSGYCTEQ